MSGDRVVTGRLLVMFAIILLAGLEARAMSKAVFLPISAIVGDRIAKG